MAGKKSPTGEKIALRGVRLSFPSLDKPTKTNSNDPNENPKYRASFLLDPKDDAHKVQIKAINAEINRLIKEMWGEAPHKMVQDCFGKGENARNRDGEIYGGYEGMWFVSALNDKRPLLMDKTGTHLTPEQVAQMMYAGCYVHAQVNFWCQDNTHGRAIRCSLGGVVFARDGEAFSSGGATEDDFADILGDGEIDLDLGDDDDDLGLD